MPMHADELAIDEHVVRRLIAEQFPQWRDEPVHRMTTDGTVSAIFRIGDALAARFPLRDADPREARALIAEETAAMRELAASCPFPTPLPVAEGAPGAGYPLPWSVQTWLPGTVATPHGLAHSEGFTRDLVHLVQSLRAADTRGRAFAGSGRGGSLTDADEWMQVCFERSVGLLPVDRLRALWAELRDLPAAGPDVMTHGDLIPGNLLVDGEHLVGVLDGGGFGPTDPALDLVGAWHLLDVDMRAVLRAELECDDVEWRRGAAWALQQSMGLVWYYRETSPGMSRLGESTLRRILAAFGR
ncbi:MULTISPECIES: aminoglycoside phosphotransferase family protein [unclassified Microbacterium]|uniref:aminoglycoside phosphotransferase family protein n=1 Tax=unclassified Microbacterium TaxID=2609290 RepID=UPI00214C1B95|nr:MULTISPECIES: aminoglycoside phosphotransferase family protein [unclassified Microbacterium]MCR2783935.1 aminoglycoside phosphotransferase family protein [Microbacterium sp. zg.B96]WIM15221.1 aminoglycoside phosphotransferase family protein [Microbacterium sp. zg-B96]